METILTPELQTSTWTPKVGDLAINFNTPCRILEIGYTDSWGGFHPEMVLCRIIDGGGKGQKFTANINLLQPAI